jgi:hypothetical protein
VAPGRRLPALLLVLALLAIPPVVMRALCVGSSCGAAAAGPARVPFCPLPDEVKSLVAAGYRAGRSPDVMAVTAGSTVVGGGGGSEGDVPWPRASPAPDPRVPIAFSGTGIARGRPLPEGTGLDQIAPTLAEAVGLVRPHPEIRAGHAVPGVATEASPRLVVEIVWRGVGTADLQGAPRDWPFLRSLVRGGSGAATLDGTTGSLPFDPTATLATIGTGGLPSQHGITGGLLRNDERAGQVVSAWSSAAPTSVIATFPDDLVNEMGGRPLVGLVAPEPADRGLVGDGWAYANPPYRERIGGGDPVADVRGMLGEGFGADASPDVLGVVLDGSLATMDRRTGAIVDEVRHAVPAATFAVTATGSDAAPAGGSTTTADRVASEVDRSVGSPDPIVQAETPGGLFLDQAVLASRGLSSNAVVDALLALRSPTGDEKLFRDAFPGFAVSFARYC